MLKPKNHYALITLTAAGLLLTGLAGAALAQDDSAQSVAEAARRAREKKKASVKPVKTLTDDDLPKAASAAGPADASAPATAAKADESGTAQTPAAAAKPADAASVEKAKLVHAANVAGLERAKKSLAQSEGELDVMQRKEKLDSDSYYSKPDFSNDPEGKAKLDAQAQDITTKQEDIETLKARIAELQAAVDAGAPTATEGKPPSEEKPPSQ